jgi:hypothetical protein
VIDRELFTKNYQMGSKMIIGAVGISESEIKGSKEVCRPE